jgi:hypothetical protein
VSIALFKKVDHHVERLIDEIETGEIGLPDIQRPFVWKAAKVRDLFDSMYQGFPVGYLLFWANANVGNSRGIGAGTKQSPPRLLIVDGQQRLTSLYAVMRGVPVLDENFTERRIRIAFRPRDGRFAVPDATTDRDPEYLPDITQLWVPGKRRTVVRDFFERLQAAREHNNDELDPLEDAIDRAYDLRAYPFTAMELGAQVSEEQVAEIFVRVNSEGVTLNQDDFILTLMSVFWEEGRRDLEKFSRAARVPAVGQASPFNHFLQPDPGQMLRVSVALAFRRGALRHVYSLLRGRDVETGQYSEASRDRQFAALRAAQAVTLDLNHWHEFLKTMVRAGFRSNKMVTSNTAVLYAYALYLIGRQDYGVDAHSLRQVIARWFFMSTLTARYSSSPESRFEQDLGRLPKDQTPEAFVDAMNTIIDQTLTGDFWTTTLPQNLATSAARGPSLFAYYAALILLDAKVLFSNLRVAELFDPAVRGNRSSLERHHLFPKGYLSGLGISGTRDVNQIANFALVEWPDNAAISDTPPKDYWPGYAARLSAPELDDARFLHALPSGWELMDYGTFLEQRRRLMARVIKRGFDVLSGNEQPPEPDLSALVAEGESQHLEFKSTARWNIRSEAKDPDLEWVVVKTVAGFANAAGGSLLIGVDDHGHPLGLEHDLKLVPNADVDRFELWLRGLFETALGKVTATGIRITFPALDSTQVCRIDVPMSTQPVFANKPKAQRTDDFYVRSGNSTRQLTPQEVVDYLQQRAAGVNV